jgi:hypothetical protein
VFKAHSVAVPKPPVTKYSHPSCYLAPTGDCSNDISGEHYLSRTILEALGPGIRLGGLPFLKPGEERVVGINTLTVNVLCRRHNAALSWLDDEAGRFFRTLHKIEQDLLKRSLSRKSTAYLFSGIALEMWMVKVACGLYFGRIAGSSEQRMADSHAVNSAAAIAALTRGQFAPRAGMYLRAFVNDENGSGSFVQLAPISVDEDQAHRFVGLRTSLRGHEFDALFDVRGLKLPAQGCVYRPAELIFTNEQRRHYVTLSWPTGTTIVSLTANARRPTPQPPSP